MQAFRLQIFRFRVSEIKVSRLWRNICCAKLLLGAMGTNGLEPSTSRLSGVRSNHLSYAPKWILPLRPLVLPLVPLVEMRRIELLTPCVQGRCSPSWATPPYYRDLGLSFCAFSRYFLWVILSQVSSKLNSLTARTHSCSNSCWPDYEPLFRLMSP